MESLKGLSFNELKEQPDSAEVQQEWKRRAELHGYLVAGVSESNPGLVEQRGAQWKRLYKDNITLLQEKKIAERKLIDAFFEKVVTFDDNLRYVRDGQKNEFRVWATVVRNQPSKQRAWLLTVEMKDGSAFAITEEEGAEGKLNCWALLPGKRTFVKGGLTGPKMIKLWLNDFNEEEANKSPTDRKKVPVHPLFYLYSGGLAGQLTAVEPFEVTREQKDHEKWVIGIKTGTDLKAFPFGDVAVPEKVSPWKVVVGLALLALSLYGSYKLWKKVKIWN
ncbi:MAG: hypothetical protein AB7F31_00445 [Parachlamydiales bacterium]